MRDREKNASFIVLKAERDKRRGDIGMYANDKDKS
jgi:hypothetical protein